MFPLYYGIDPVYYCSICQAVLDGDPMDYEQDDHSLLCNQCAPNTASTGQRRAADEQRISE
jgi:hypothetical protein